MRDPNQLAVKFFHFQIALRGVNTPETLGYRIDERKDRRDRYCWTNT